jgi:hypothetical protein
MSKNSFLILLLVLTSSFTGFAQDNKLQPGGAEGLSFYPNPVNNGKIYLTSKTSLDKEIIIFDVLGKKVFQNTVSSKEISLANLMPGVYIIKLREGELTTTRKLIIK